MSQAPILASGHTASDGTLSLKVETGVPDSDVMVEIRVLPVNASLRSGEVENNGWPVGFLDRFAGSMPDLERWPQGEYEDRLPL